MFILIKFGKNIKLLAYINKVQLVYIDSQIYYI